MAEWWEWTGEPGPWESNAAPDMYAGGSPTFNEGGGDYFQGPAYQQFTGWGDPTGPGTSGDSGGGNWLQQLLSGGGQALGSLFGQGGAGGPLLSALGSIGGGAIGSNAANEAARLQAARANRGLDIQQAMWLQNLERQAPWLQAGREALPQLQQLAGQGQQAPFQPGASIDPRAYGMPDATPRWTPQGYDGPQGPNAGDYRWNPQAGPQAANYRYTPGDIPQASQYRYTPGAVPTLSGQELLANDPGVQFRLDQGRKALEGSAAARGGLLSGPTLAALQRSGQELSSQEYSNAWNRASQQAQLREGWAQTASQMGWGQAESEARLREQVNQVASQQGWTQAQAEAAFREGLAQQSSQQGWNQALAGQQNAWTQGLEGQKWLQAQNQLAADQLYNRNMDQYKMVVGQDVARNETDYARQLAAYNSQLQGQNTQWNRLAGLADVGQTSVGQLATSGQENAQQQASILSQLGTAQGAGALGNALSWQRAISGAGNQLPSILAGLNA